MQITRRATFSVATQVALIAGINLVYSAYPVTYIKLIAEDNVGEYSTFVSLMMAFCLFAYLFISSQTKKRDFWFVLLALGGFFIGMEEISWGQRILDISTPAFLVDVNFQREISLHNIQAIAPYETTYLMVSVGCVVYGLLLPTLATVSSRVDRLIKRIHLPLPSLHLAPLFLATAIYIRFTSVTDREIGELLFGITLGCMALDLALSQMQPILSNKLKKIPTDIGIPLFIISIFMAGGFCASYWGDPMGNFQNRLNSYAGVILPSMGKYKQAEALISYMEKHPEFAKKDLLIDKGNVLVLMGRKEESIEVFKRALKVEEERNMVNPKDPETVRRIARIHSKMGNEEMSRRSFENLQELYAEAMRATSSPRNIAQFHMNRAEIFHALGEHTSSLEEYLGASELPLDARFRNRIMWGIVESLSLCQYGDRSHGHILKWEEVEAMAQEWREKGMVWCSEKEER